MNPAILIREVLGLAAFLFLFGFAVVVAQWMDSMMQRHSKQRATEDRRPVRVPVERVRVDQDLIWRN